MIERRLTNDERDIRVESEEEKYLKQCEHKDEKNKWKLRDRSNANVMSERYYLY